MIELRLDPNKKGRVWLGHMPDLPPTAVEHSQEVLHADGSPGSRATAAAVELYVHMGPRVRYGLLGGRFTPGDGDQLTVQVRVSGSGGELIAWSLASSIDVVRAGLPEDCLHGVYQGVKSVDAGRLLGAGVLRFDCAAYGEAGSSAGLFRQLAAMVVRLLDIDPGATSEDELIGLLRHELNRPQPSGP